MSRAVILGTLAPLSVQASTTIPTKIDATITGRLARLALAHVTREFPINPAMTRNAPTGSVSPRVNRPIFYGSFGWDGSVATHWLLARIHRTWPRLAEAHQIRTHFDAAFSEATVAAEMAFFNTPMNQMSGRPGGWAWVMMMADEFANDPDPRARAWAKLFAPMVDDFERRILEYLPKLRYPGQDGGTPFALLRIATVAREGSSLRRLVEDNARHWYEAEVVPAAPSIGGEEAMPAQMGVAVLMRRVMPSAEFQTWFRKYMPDLARGEPSVLLTPVDAGDRLDRTLTQAADSYNMLNAGLMRELAAFCGNAKAAGTLRRAAAQCFAASFPHLEATYPNSVALPPYALIALEDA